MQTIVSPGETAVQTIYASCTVGAVGVADTTTTSDQPLRSETSEAIGASQKTGSSALATTGVIPVTKNSQQTPPASTLLATQTAKLSTSTLRHAPVSSAAPPLASAKNRIPTSVSPNLAAQTGHSVDNNEKPSSSLSKGASAGAAIGGILALLLLIAAILSTLRWYMRRKRQKRTRELRSSWFYGGDVAEPDDSIGHNGTRERQLQSRFSAHSFASRESSFIPDPTPAPALFGLPISHMRSGSGPFPRVFGGLRHSSYPPKDSSHSVSPLPAPSRIVNNNTTPAPLNPRQLLRAFPQVPQMPSERTTAPLSSSRRAFGHELPPRFTPAGDPMTPGFSANTPDSAPSPSRAPEGGSDLDWEHLGSSGDSPPVTTGQGRPPLESFYSAYTALSGPSTRVPLLAENQVAQAVSAPEESFMVADFPVPPDTQRTTRPSILLRPPSATRSVVPLATPLPNNLVPSHAPRLGDAGRSSREGGSALFEYSAYDPVRASRMTTDSATTRGTRDWYEQSLWDVPLQALHGDPEAPQSEWLGRDPAWIWESRSTGQAPANPVNRKSRSKSVRWEDDAAVLAFSANPPRAL